MKILYFGSFCDKEQFEKVIKKRKTPYSVAQYMFESALLGEMIDDDNLELSINYIYRDLYFPKNNIFIFKNINIKKINGVIINYISFINLPFIKELCMLFGGAIKVFKWWLLNRKIKDKIVILSIQYPPLAIGVRIVSYFFKLKCILIVTDVTKSTYDKKKDTKIPLYKRSILGVYRKIVAKLEKSYNAYIFFSEPMNKLINERKRPYIIIEGIYNPDGIDLTSTEKKKAIMHAGTLSENVGVKKIIDIFMEINEETLELWLFGDGDLREYIENSQVKDSRIKFYGFRPREEVFHYQKQASLLINLRNPKDEYTKYSFPSKSFEYMVSGTPFLTTKLECLPKEYEKYLILVEEYDDETIKKQIQLSLLGDENKLKGMAAKKFILENKTPRHQKEKVIKFIRGL